MSVKRGLIMEESHTYRPNKAIRDDRPSLAIGSYRENSIAIESESGDSLT